MVQGHFEPGIRLRNLRSNGEPLMTRAALGLPPEEPGERGTQERGGVKGDPPKDPKAVLGDELILQRDKCFDAARVALAARAARQLAINPRFLVAFGGDDGKPPGLARDGS